jgi:PAS domain S-box-containing protein
VPWMADSEGLITEASPQWTALTGLTEEESMGWGWARALHPEDVEEAGKKWRHSIETGESVDVEYMVKTPDGRWVWMRSRASARRDESGKVIRWYGAVENIDDYKRAKEELEASAARLQGVFDAVPVGIVIAEAPGGRVVMGNPQAEAIFGHPIIAAGDIEAHGQWLMFHPDGRRVAAQEYPLVRAIVKGETSAAQEFLYQRGDGTKAWISMTAAPILGQDGHILGGVVTIRDIDAEHRKASDEDALARV